MGKDKKAKKSAVKKVEIPAEKKAEMKKSLRAFKAERDAAVTEHDKKKIKAARTKMKKINLKLKRVTTPPPAPKAEAAS